MKARYAYPLVFFVPSAMLASLLAVAAAGAGAGLLWLFVYGDDPWPQAAGSGIMAFAVAVAIVALALLLHASYAFGRRREDAGLARRHVVLALVVTVSLPLLAVLHQWQVGNLG
jgi:ABC-type amino acid transport system permease subunit